VVALVVVRTQELAVQRRDRFFDLLAFIAQLGNHLRDVHVWSLR
jgi:hypothetical protein